MHICTLGCAVASVQLLILKTFVKINLIISICVLHFCSALETCIFNETKQERLRYDIRHGDKSVVNAQVTMYDAWGSHFYIAVLCCDCITNEPLIVNYSTILNEAETGGASPNSLVHVCVCVGVESCIRMPLAFGILSPPYRMETPSREAHSAAPVIKSAVPIAELSAGPATMTHAECKSYSNYGVTVLYPPICTQRLQAP